MNREELETITNNNLEIQELNQYIKKIQEAYKQLEKENLDLRIQISSREEVANELEDRIYKAIEYIEGRFTGEEIQQGEDWNFFEHWHFDTIDKWEAEELLDILKGTNERE